jgi:hypothetical protein
MRTFIITLAIILGITALAVFIKDHTETYQIKGVCKKTLITYDHRSEHTDYTVILQYEDGEVEDLQMYDGKSFFDYKEGHTYYFYRSRWNWNKKN